MPPSVLEQLTNDNNSPPSTNSDMPTVDYTELSIDIIPIAVSELSKITDKAAADADLQETNKIGDNDQLQLDPSQSLVSSNNKTADTTEVVNEVNTVDMTSISTPH